jgi:hypothetical protein
LIPIFIGLGIPNLNSMILILAGVTGILLFGGSLLTIYGDMSDKVAETEEGSFNALNSKGVSELPSGDNFETAESIVENTTRELETSKI